MTIAGPFATKIVHSTSPLTTYGSQYATTNAGLLYTAKGTSAWVVPLASLLKNYTGTWHSVFVIAAFLNLAVAGLALFVLKPLRHRAMGRA